MFEVPVAESALFANSKKSGNVATMPIPIPIPWVNNLSKRGDYGTPVNFFN
jgi:hypothetical protein